MKSAIIVLLLVSGGNAYTQTESQFSPAIEDNSFFIEEAYNQEPGVVQHILNGVSPSVSLKPLYLSFTQEWPLWGELHQFSYTILYSMNEVGGPNGIGDVLLNYRYQLLGSESRIAVAPRLSISLPSGNVKEGHGTGTTGVLVTVPASMRLSDPFVAHANLGFAIFPDAKRFDENGVEARHTLSAFTGGVSLIWLASSCFNIMLECFAISTSEFDEQSNVVQSATTIISPGFRYAIDVGELQMVPGIALPLTVADGTTKAGVFLYLSFEHPF